MARKRTTDKPTTSKPEVKSVIVSNGEGLRGIWAMLKPETQEAIQKLVEEDLGHGQS